MKRLILAGAMAATLAFGTPALAQTAYHLAGKTPLSDGGWDYVSVDPALHRLYVARTDAVTAVDLGAGAVTDKLAAAARGHQVLPLPGGKELLVTNGASGTAEFIDSMTGKSLGSVKVGKSPDAAILDPKSGLAIVVNHAGGTVSLLDTKKRISVADIQVGGTALEYAAIDPAGHLFVNDEDTAEMAEIDLVGRKLMKRIKLAGCEGPTGLAYLPVSMRLMASCANGVAALVDPAKARFDKTFPTGKGADAVIHDASRKLAFVPAGQSGDLTIFADEAKGVRVIATIPTQTGARTGAVDEKTGKLYLPAAEYTPPTTAGGRPQVKPGSVVLVEIDP